MTVPTTPTPTTRGGRPHAWQRFLRPAVAGFTALVTATGAYVLAGPEPPQLTRSSGDADLARRALDVIGAKGVSAASVALIEDDGRRVTYAGLNTDVDTSFEIGSVGKVLTGMLLADAVRRGEVRLDQPVSELGIDGSATLTQLATHTSGLPRLDLGVRTFTSAWWSRMTGANPYSGDPADVLAAASRRAPAGGGYAYSNLGMAVLGDLLARRAEVSYPGLLGDRLLAPLGMTSTVVATSPDDVPAGGAVPRDASGREQAPWTALGWAPAGIGVWSTTADLARLVRATMAGTAPGADAARPLRPAGAGNRIGLAWQTSVRDGREITWHNGASGGSRAFVGFDPAAGRGVVVLATTDRNLDDAAIQLLEEGR